MTEKGSFRRLLQPFKLPSLRSPYDLLFILTCLVLTVMIVAPEIWGHGKSKDYPLWFHVGQRVLHGLDIYFSDDGPEMDFLYPPFSAVLLALPSLFGKVPLYVLLSLVNAVSWWVTIQVANAMAEMDKAPNAFVTALPALLMFPFVYDMFDLGQPNLLLLALMLSGFWLLRYRYAWQSGVLFALAISIKVFPLAMFPYLLWRRRWVAAASTAAFVAIFTFIAPAPFRGFERNAVEVGTWVQRMVLSASADGFGQRAQQNWSWVNQSVVAVTHRLTRPVDYRQAPPGEEPAYINLLDVDYNTANMIVVGVSVLLGLGFLFAMPPASRLTPRSETEEIGMLFCLMTIASPLARQYYFLWLFLPLTILIQRAVCDPRPGVRRGTAWLLGTVACLMLLSLQIFPKFFQAIGNNLWATLLVFAGLAWYARHPAQQPAIAPAPDDLAAVYTPPNQENVRIAQEPMPL